MYNKNGRIGIYTRQEREAIIARFKRKRGRRVWKKKIRYVCLCVGWGVCVLLYQHDSARAHLVYSFLFYFPSVST